MSICYNLVALGTRGLDSFDCRCAASWLWPYRIDWQVQSLYQSVLVGISSFTLLLIKTARCRHGLLTALALQDLGLASSSNWSKLVHAVDLQKFYC